MEVSLREAVAADAPRLDAALRALSEAMGDRHVATLEEVERCGFGPDPAFRAMLAEWRDDCVGAALFSPLFSTTRGGAGVYVSDLWVREDMRGQRLGERLLAAVRDAARQRWNARFLRLSVYDGNVRALSFYERTGFRPIVGDTALLLDGSAWETTG